jgi:epoxyqueuosine reductase QueG
MGEEQLKSEVKDFLKNLGSFRVGVADPRTGFSHALNGCRPTDVMKDCRSVIVFALNIGLDYYRDVDFEHNNNRLGHLYRDSATLRLITFLRGKGYDAEEVPREHADHKNMVARMSFKLAACEAGIGVFGRSSVILTPEFGPRVNLGVVLTDAVLMPDQPMKGFSPCENCNRCMRICPVCAIEEKMPPPTGFDREKCVNFVDWIKRRTNEKVKLCGRCFNRCPAGKLIHRTLRVKKWMTLDDLTVQNQRRLVNEFNTSAG